MNKVLRFAKVFAPAVVLAGLVGLPFSHTQAGDNYCAEREDLLSLLEESMALKPLAVGVTERGGVLEVLSAPNGAWTMIVTTPQGKACMVSSGEGWRNKAPKPQDPVA